MLILKPGRNNLIFDSSAVGAGPWFELPRRRPETVAWGIVIEAGTLSAMTVNLEAQLNPFGQAGIELSQCTAATGVMPVSFASVSSGKMPLIRANLTAVTVATGFPQIKVYLTF